MINSILIDHFVLKSLFTFLIIFLEYIPRSLVYGLYGGTIYRYQADFHSACPNIHAASAESRWCCIRPPLHPAELPSKKKLYFILLCMSLIFKEVIKTVTGIVHLFFFSPRDVSIYVFTQLCRDLLSFEPCESCVFNTDNNVCVFRWCPLLYLALTFCWDCCLTFNWIMAFKKI